MSGYDEIAHLYDALVTTDVDLDFLTRLTARSTGPVLELMAGTGRVSLALHRTGARLACVDRSAAMLRILAQKFAGVVSPPVAVCADVRQLPLVPGFTLAVLPFNAFAEVTAPEDQRRTLEEVHRVLGPGGQFVCTLHNPVVRVASLDGVPRRHAERSLDEARHLEVWVCGTIHAPGLASSVQTYCVLDGEGGVLEEHVQTVRFALLAPEAFLTMAEGAGFAVESVCGDYDGAPFDAAQSPYMIWTLMRS